jgi:dienelactone hydrolase
VHALSLSNPVAARRESAGLCAMPRTLLPLLAVLVLAACGGSETAATTAQPTPSGPFAYDASAPLDVEEREVDDIDGARVVDVSYAVNGRRAPAYLITPKTGERRPAVIFLHGSGGDRRQMLPFAARWTADGGVALTVEDARARNTTSVAQELRAQRDAATETVLRVRRAVDYLRSLDGVDPERIGFVGWSAGARTGAIVAGVEPRIDAFVLMSGGATPLDEYVRAAPQAIRPDVRRFLGAVDPLRWVRRARANTIFFQDGRSDTIVPPEALNGLRNAAPAPQRLRWYDAGHELNAKAYADGRVWLAQRLALKR